MMLWGMVDNDISRDTDIHTSQTDIHTSIPHDPHFVGQKIVWFEMFHLHWLSVGYDVMSNAKEREFILRSLCIITH